ncbi:hypothetical protein SAMN04487886_11924 [Clostridium sp. DSM 8431]|uniref:hypothetical protein n=1 Tax=Clostridium sp. DSM 8431 TaxID=1761781 RepID=UPI0008E897B1|nr:hypothetical protein [Clostridium sp. DSM 8431]SFU82354.1 hypothetical protein SAMN04487886_11924 [Clostridium sp. DSM 8431]
MIHTGEFFVILDVEHDAAVIEEMNERKVYTCTGCRIVCRKTRVGKCILTRLHLVVDFIELLGKADITPSDVDDINYRIRRIVEDIVDNDNFELVLSRLDYRFDVVIKDKEERAMILKLLKKSCEKHNYMRKINKYRNTVRFFSKSRSNNFYDKEVERMDKNKEIKPYEKDVMRFEAQIKNEHTRYKKRSAEVERDIESYLTYTMYKNYMTKMVIGVTGRGDFYSLKGAIDIINKHNVSDVVKEELREFLVYTSLKRDLGKTKEKYDRYKYNKYIAILNDLNVNPIIIPEKWRKSFIANPLNKLINEFESEERYL